MIYPISLKKTLHTVIWLALPLTVGLLSSCNSSTAPDSNLTVYTGSGFSISYPKSWAQTDKQNLPQIHDGVIEFSAVSSKALAQPGSFGLLVLRGNLQKATTSKEYALNNYQSTQQNYQNFTPLNETDITFADKDSSKLYDFEAKYNSKTPVSRYLQTSKICGNKAYLLTISLGNSTEASTPYQTILQSFSCL